MSQENRRVYTPRFPVMETAHTNMCGFRNSGATVRNAHPKATLSVSLGFLHSAVSAIGVSQQAHDSAAKVSS